MEDEQWSGHVLRMHGGGKLQESIRIFVGPAGVIVDLLNVAGPHESEPVGDSSSFNRRLVAMSLRDGPRGHESSRTPSEYGETVWVRPGLCHGEISAAVDVAIGAIAEVLVNRAQEFGAVSG